MPTARLSPVDLACEETAEAMTAAGLPLVGVFLETAGRLRCRAVRGYGQLFDGIAPGIGVIGQVWASGQARSLVDVRHEPGYRPALADVVAEAAVPVIAPDGQVVGVLNAESTTALPPDTLATLTRLAAALADRLTALGGPTGLTPSQRLMVHAARLAEAETAPGVVDALLEAAVQTSGLGSAVLLLGEAARPVAAAGPLGAALRRLPADTRARAAAWVAGGGSARTWYEPGALVPDGQAALQAAGAASTVAVPVGQGDDRLGVLLVAGPRPVRVQHATVETLELLGALGAAHLRSAQLTDGLRRQASTDALTGLGHRSAFADALAHALHEAGNGQRVAVLALDLDGFKQVNDSAGHAAGDEVLRRAASAMSGALREGDRLYRLGGDEFATVLVVHGEEEAVGVAERVLAACRAGGVATVSVGVAVAGEAETPEGLLARADAALYDTKRNGRDGLTLAS